MKLGAVSHLNQGWPKSILPAAEAIGADILRDGINWSQIAKPGGGYVFAGGQNTYPDALDAAGLPQIMVFGRPKAHADGGRTPYTDAGRAEFADFVAAVLDRFPSVGIVEIGNEFNGQNFVNGPVKRAHYRERDDYYVELLKAVHERLEGDHDDVKILGGATHSVPVGYLRHTFELGALDYSDGIVVHPYTSTPDHVADHIGLLQAAMGGRQQPIYVTEFGKAFQTRQDAPDYLVKMVAGMAAAGVEVATWYALREQGRFPNMELVDKSGATVPAGDAFALMARLLDEGRAEDVSPDGLTRIVRFGETGMAVWGASRDIALDAGVTAHAATGEVLTGPLRLDYGTPLVLFGAAPLKLGQNVRLGEARLVGDSYLQFDVTNAEDGTATFEGPWSWHEMRGDGQMAQLVTMEGGSRSGEIWRPYLGGPERHPLLVTEDKVRPIDWSEGNNLKARYSVVERYTAPEDMEVTIKGRWDVADRSRDGVDLAIFVDGDRVAKRVIADKAKVELDGISVEKGDTIDFVLGVNGNSKGDMTERRIKIFRDGPAEEASQEGPGPDPADPADPPASSGQGRVVAEVGEARVGAAGTTIALEHQFDDPVVIATMTEGRAGQPATARALDVRGDRFELRLDEPDHLDGRQAASAVSYMVVEAGRWDLGDGLVIEAGTASTGGRASPAKANVAFDEGFDATPSIVTTMQTMNGPEFVWTWTGDAGRDGFDLTMVEEEAQKRSSHATESVGWVAFSRGSGNAESAAGDLRIDVSGPRTKATDTWRDIEFDGGFEAAPHVLAGVQGGGNPVGLLVNGADRDGARVRLQEDTSRDAETSHSRTAIDWIAIEGDGLLLA